MWVYPNPMSAHTVAATVKTKMSNCEALIRMSVIVLHS